MDYLNEIKPFEDIPSGPKDDAFIAQVIEGITVKPILTLDAYEYFDEVGWWTNSPNGFTGKLQTAWLDTTHLDKTTETLERLWRLVFGGIAQKIKTQVEYRPNNPSIAKGCAVCET